MSAEHLTATMATMAPPTWPAERKAMLGRAGALTLIAVIVLLGCVGIGSIMLLRRHRRRVVGVHGPASRRRRPPPDPWFESARRISPRDPGGASDDDTVDLDPDELGNPDVDGPGGHRPHPPGTGPHQ